MKNQVRIKPRFYALLLLIATAIFICCVHGCDSEPMPAQTEVRCIDAILGQYESQIDSLRSEIQMRQATIENMRSELNHQSESVVNYIQVYQEAVDTAAKLQACDSLVKAAEVLVTQVHTSDSIVQKQFQDFNAETATYQTAIDSCKENYTNLSTSYTENLQQLQRTKHGLKKAVASALVSTGIVLVESAMIILR